MKTLTKIGQATRVQFETDEGIIAVISRNTCESGSTFNERYVATLNAYPDVVRCKLMTTYTDGSVQHDTLYPRG